MMGAVEHRRAASLSAFPIPSQFGHTNGIGVVVGAGRVWLVDGGAQRVSCVDPRTGTIAASATLPFPTALVTDAGGTYAAVQNEVDFLEPTSCP
jgi:streptogramin lyase